MEANELEDECCIRHVGLKCKCRHPLTVRQECAKRIAKVSADAKLEVDEETYLNQFKPHLMDVVYAWANGATFAQICKMTDVFEGLLFIFVSCRHGREVRYEDAFQN